MGDDGASSGPRYRPEYVSRPGEDEATSAMAKRVVLSLNQRGFDEGGRRRRWEGRRGCEKCPFELLGPGELTRSGWRRGRGGGKGRSGNAPPVVAQVVRDGVVYRASKPRVGVLQVVG